jgi:hypothetical protein
MRISPYALLLLMPFFVAISVKGNDSIYSEIWDIDNRTEINGHKVTFTGNPAVIETELGNALYFNGVKDKILVNSNPIGNASEFTVEMVFKADPAYSTNFDPRFLHIQDNSDPLQKRVMMELRINSSNRCYLDGFMKTDVANLTLIDEKLTHPTAAWHHVAITYANDTLTTWFNGKKELSGFVPFGLALINPIGQTSIGGRMNDRNYYKGLIRALKITRKAIDPSNFFYVDRLTASNQTANQFKHDVSVSIRNNAITILTHNFEKADSVWKIEIFNTTGKCLHQTTHKNTDIAIIPAPAQTQAKEVLLIRVSTSEMVFTKKVIR